MENDIYKFLTISFKLPPNNNKFNIIKYEIYGNNSFNMIGLVESKTCTFPDLQVKIDDNNTIFFIKVMHKYNNEIGKLYFKFLDVEKNTSNSFSNIHIDIQNINDNGSINSENYKTIISTQNIDFNRENYNRTNSSREDSSREDSSRENSSIEDSSDNDVDLNMEDAISKLCNN